MRHIGYISAFLNRPYMEGPRQTVGYIPCHKKSGGTANYKGRGDPALYRAMGVSGVTIATGVDLGQTDADTLLGYGLPDAVACALRPYFGLRQDAALRKLHALPLVVSPETAAALDCAVHGGYLRQVARRWDGEHPCAPYADLPPQVQAVVFSLCYQLGCSGARRRAKAVMEALSSGDFRAASRMLRDRARWEYPNRRQTEGLLLAEIL